MRRATTLLCAAALACAVAVAPVGVRTAAGKPPPGACRNPEPARPRVRELPWAQQYLDPQRAWRVSTGAGVTVAVVDSGVDADHEQLRRPGKVSRGRDFFLVGTLPGNYDCVSHGTAVASIIAADRRSGVGFAGIAPGARILPVRISDREVTDDGDTRAIDPRVLARGIRYAADGGAKVINLSMSGLRDHAEVREAIRYAQSKDALVVAAVGNAQQDDAADLPSYPAAYEGVLGVGAIDIAGARSNGSQVGNYVDLVAPGAGVLGATRVAGHAYFTGTSFATAFVSGTAALVRAAWPSLDARQTAQRLLATATPARGGPGSMAYGAGVVDPYRAVAEGMGGERRALPDAVRPTPDPAHVAELAWWQYASRRAHMIGMVIVGGTAVLLVLGAAILLGRRRRWQPARTSLTRSSSLARSSSRRDNQLAPDRLFDMAKTPGPDSR
ncbi:type VII secretion-associated serine protease mycosin [Actinomycetes bacterium KLBMP 9797]